MSEGNWHRVARADEIDDDEPKRVMVGNEDIALYKVDGSIYATSDICTHAFASLSEGFQEGAEIECPLHAGRFHIPTGKALSDPVTDDVQIFEVRIEDGEVLVKV